MENVEEAAGVVIKTWKTRNLNMAAACVSRSNSSPNVLLSVPTSKSDDGEPYPKRVQLDEEEEECEGWDRWGEKEYLIYSFFFMNSTLPDDVEVFHFLEDHVRKNRGFDINVCPPTEPTLFHLVLPPDAPIPEELKDFPRVDPSEVEVVTQRVYAFAKSAVDVQNEKMASKLEFVKVLKAFTFHCPNGNGNYYYITLVALDKRTGDYRKCQTRVFTSKWYDYLRMTYGKDTMGYGVDSFWVKGKVDAAALRPEVPQSWPSHWELTRLREDEMRTPYG